ncbi:MAG: hypothetical protein ACK559_23845, partial [bacterium]
DHRLGGLLLARAREALAAHRAVLLEQLRQRDFGRALGDGDVFLHDVALREGVADLSEVFLQAADEHIVELSLQDGNSRDEPRLVEDVEQRAERVRVAVVGCRRQEQSMLETRRDVADGSGDLRVDRVPSARRWGGVMRFVEDEE